MGLLWLAVAEEKEKNLQRMCEVQFVCSRLVGLSSDMLFRHTNSIELLNITRPAKIIIILSISSCISFNSC